MKSKSDVTQENLRLLADKREISESLWNMAVEVAVYHHRRAESQGCHVAESAEDDAGDFLIHLADRSPAALRAIHSRSALSREYGKWVVHERSPATKEVWEAVSRALLALEREETIVRAAEFRQFNNSNKTRWTLPENEGGNGRLLTDEEVQSVKPDLSTKSDKRRILNPTEAKKWLLGLLELAEGEVAMQDLFHEIKSSLSVFEVVSGEDLSPDDEQAAEDAPSWLDQFSTAQIAPDLEARIEEEIEFAVARVWEDAGEIRRGDNPVIEGLRILCCYWLPKNVYGRKMTLQDFGPKSTVKDVAMDLSRMMARYVPFPKHVEPDESDQLACLRVASGVIEGISGLCSENGYCRRFNA